MLPLETLLAFFDFVDASLAAAFFYFVGASLAAAFFSPLEIALTSFSICFGSTFSFFVLVFGFGKRLAPSFLYK